jgi:hypothetical protein
VLASPVDLKLLEAVDVKDGNEVAAALLAHVQLDIATRNNPVKDTCARITQQV